MPDEHLPWATAPGQQGHAFCEWCDRAIYAPALPCSVRPVAGLLTMATQPGQGERCKYELTTRVGGMASDGGGPAFGLQNGSSG